MVFITIFYGIQIAINNYNVGLALWVWVGAAYLVLLGQHVLLQKLLPAFSRRSWTPKSCRRTARPR